jgi:hypothetical protein
VIVTAEQPAVQKADQGFDGKLDVFLTVDVEIWCDGWRDIDAKFPDAFKRYVYGPTANGEYGLPYTLRELTAHGLVGSFFVEPLFSTRFGIEPLAEIVALIRNAGQEIQLHLHTEWVDEARTALLSNVREKKQYLRHFSLAEQTQLIDIGLRLLGQAGQAGINAFRAGSFGFNRDTLDALAANGIEFDSSYNAGMFGPDSGVMPGTLLFEPIACAGVHEYPLTVFRDGRRALRPAQVGSCSFREMEGLLWQALESRRRSFVILSHNFEMMNLSRTRADDIVVRRFHDLCQFLSRNADCFRVRGFRGLTGVNVESQPAPLTAPLWQTGLRIVEQVLRRRYG